MWIAARPATGPQSDPAAKRSQNRDAGQNHDIRNGEQMQPTIEQHQAARPGTSRSLLTGEPPGGPEGPARHGPGAARHPGYRAGARRSRLPACPRAAAGRRPPTPAPDTPRGTRARPAGRLGWRCPRGARRCSRARWAGPPISGRRGGRILAGNGRLEGRRRGRRCACRAGMMTAGEGVAATIANWLMLIPGLIFGTVPALICYRMPGSRASAHRHRPDGR